MNPHPTAEPGDRVVYHGSITADHGPGTLVEPCHFECRECDDEWEAIADGLYAIQPHKRDYSTVPMRWKIRLDTPIDAELHHVRPASFTRTCPDCLEAGHCTPDCPARKETP